MLAAQSDWLGLVTDVYSRLHSREENIVPLGGVSNNRLRVPHTIVIKNQVATVWYFTSVVDGRLRRKNKRNTTFNDIFRVLTKAATKNKWPIVAVFIASELELGQSSPVTYLNHEKLEEFLFEDAKPDGLLQQFVEPMGTRNSTIRATWSPRVSLVEQCTNMHQMGNRKLLFRDRAGTFDEHLHSRIEPIPLTSFAGANVVSLCAALVLRMQRLSWINHAEKLLHELANARSKQLMLQGHAPSGAAATDGSSQPERGRHGGDDDSVDTVSSDTDDDDADAKQPAARAGSAGSSVARPGSGNDYVARERRRFTLYAQKHWRRGQSFKANVLHSALASTPAVRQIRTQQPATAPDDDRPDSPPTAFAKAVFGDAEGVNSPNHFGLAESDPGAAHLIMPPGSEHLGGHPVGHPATLVSQNSFSQYTSHLGPRTAFKFMRPSQVSDDKATTLEAIEGSDADSTASQGRSTASAMRSPDLLVTPTDDLAAPREGVPRAASASPRGHTGPTPTVDTRPHSSVSSRGGRTNLGTGTGAGAGAGAGAGSGAAESAGDVEAETDERAASRLRKLRRAAQRRRAQQQALAFQEKLVKEALDSTGFFFPELETIYSQRVKRAQQWRRDVRAMRRRLSQPATRENLARVTDLVEQHKGAGDGSGSVASDAPPTIHEGASGSPLSPQQQQQQEQQHKQQQGRRRASVSTVDAAFQARHQLFTGVVEHKIKLAVFYFRRGADGSLYFLFCGRLDMTSKKDARRVTPARRNSAVQSVNSGGSKNGSPNSEAQPPRAHKSKLMGRRMHRQVELARRRTMSKSTMTTQASTVAATPAAGATPGAGSTNGEAAAAVGTGGGAGAPEVVEREDDEGESVPPSAAEAAAPSSQQTPESSPQAPAQAQAQAQAPHVESKPSPRMSPHSANENAAAEFMDTLYQMYDEAQYKKPSSKGTQGIVMSARTRLPTLGKGRLVSRTPKRSTKAAAESLQAAQVVATPSSIWGKNDVGFGSGMFVHRRRNLQLATIPKLNLDAVRLSRGRGADSPVDDDDDYDNDGQGPLSDEDFAALVKRHAQSGDLGGFAGHNLRPSSPIRINTRPHGSRASAATDRGPRRRHLHTAKVPTATKPTTARAAKARVPAPPASPLRPRARTTRARVSQHRRRLVASKGRARAQPTATPKGKPEAGTNTRDSESDPATTDPAPAPAPAPAPTATATAKQARAQAYKHSHVPSVRVLRTDATAPPQRLSLSTHSVDSSGSRRSVRKSRATAVAIGPSSPYGQARRPKAHHVIKPRVMLQPTTPPTKA